MICSTFGAMFYQIICKLSVANKIGLNFREYCRGSIATEQGGGVWEGDTLPQGKKLFRKYV